MFPIPRTCYRTLDPDFRGAVFVADIDRTYLMTRFSSLRGMAKIPFERAEHKQDIEGMARLFREIRSGPDDQTRDTPLYFVSASPSQLRPVIEKKMELDGIGFDGTTFKDWGKVVGRMRLHRLREQIGFKLTALLSNRAELPVGAAEYLLGDDLEHDPLTYCLYADLLAGRIGPGDATRLLELNGVLPVDAKAIVTTLRALRPGDGVQRALIRLERHAEPEALLDFAPGVVPCTGAFQMAVTLWRLGCVGRGAIGRVASAMLRRKIAPDLLAHRLGDLVRRAVIDRDDGERIAAELVQGGLIEPIETWPEVDPVWERQQARVNRVWTPARYLGE